MTTPRAAQPIHHDNGVRGKEIERNRCWEASPWCGHHHRGDQFSCETDTGAALWGPRSPLDDPRRPPLLVITDPLAIGQGKSYTTF